MAIKPLAGIRVLDMTNQPPGAFATVMLADLGAEIVKVEPPKLKGKPSLLFGQVALSRAKKSITLDTRDPAAPAVLDKLAAGFDILVENGMPGTMDKRGFGYERAKAANAGIIWCAITGFGQDGPYAHYTGHDLAYISQSGLLAALSAELPWHPAMALALQAGAHSAVIAMQGALLARQASGEGAFIDVSLAEASGWLTTCGINPLSGNQVYMPVSPDRRLYACADGRFVAVTSAEPRTWQALCDGLDLPGLKDALHQRDRAEEATAVLAETFLARPAAQWCEMLSQTGASVMIVNRDDDLLADPHAQARGSFVECAGVPVPANPVRMSTHGVGQSMTDRTAPTTVGHDTAEVLRSVGFADVEIGDLESAGVI